MPTISLCMIVKDEEAILGRCLSSVREIVDEIIIVDTGSTDKTVEVAEGFGAKIYRFPWVDDFAAAREESFAHATGDWILWLDSDDVLEDAPKLKLRFEEVTKNDPTVNVFFLPYIYSSDEHGNANCVLQRERLLRNDRPWLWKDPIHEYILLDDVRIWAINDISVRHLRDPDIGNRIPTRNRRILEKMLADRGLDGMDPRHLAYLGDERRATGDLEGAVWAYEQYFPRSEWEEERYQVLVKAARTYLKLGNRKRAGQLALNADTVCPHWPDAQIVLAELKLDEQEFPKVVTYAERALAYRQPDTVLILNPLDYILQPHVLRAVAIYEMGDYAEALTSVDKALAIMPNHPLMLELKDKATRGVEAKRIAESVGLLVTSCSHHPVAILDALSPVVKSLPDVQDLYWEHTHPARVSPSVSIYTGPHIEPWGPRTLDAEGIGGSETATVHMSRCLADLGWDVGVFGDPGSQMGHSYRNKVSGGAEYWAAARHFDPTVPVDLFISSRIPEIFEQDLSASEKWLWLHDINLGDRLKPEHIAKIDLFLVLSEFQKSTYKTLYGIPDDKFCLIRNGLDPAKIERALVEFKPRNLTKDPFRFVWSSSPDRGLKYLLQMWPDIVGRYPQATLHIYYGWDNIDKMAAYNPGLAQVKKEIEPMLMQPGIVWEGRKPQSELYVEMLSSGVWLYPTLFLETFCITAIESMACGVRCITSNTGALTETVGDYGTLIDGSPEYVSVRKKFLDALDEWYAADPEVRGKALSAAAQHAMALSWKTLAEDWDTHIRPRVREKVVKRLSKEGKVS